MLQQEVAEERSRRGNIETEEARESEGDTAKEVAKLRERAWSERSPLVPGGSGGYQKGPAPLVPKGLGIGGDKIPQAQLGWDRSSNRPAWGESG
jgi:hypothetical protein